MGGSQAAAGQALTAMPRHLAGVVFAMAILWRLADAAAETVVLRSGKQVEIIDGALTRPGAEAVLSESTDWLKTGRVDYARECWNLLIERSKGTPADRARAAQERLKGAEFESFIVLGSHQILKGNVKAFLRSDLLGLEGKNEIPLWSVEEIAAEYHPGLSQVSKTFYPFTMLEVKLRGEKVQTTKMSGEVEFVVERADGVTHRAVLGKLYELLRPQNLLTQLEAMTRDRIIKVVIYPGLTIPE
jgi:hypothetical protein